MTFIELVKKRSATRIYLDKKVEEEKLQLVLEAGRAAPVVVNTQPPGIFVIQDEDGFKKLRKGAYIYEAPLAVLVCAEQNDAWKRPFDGKYMAEIDASITTVYMMLQAAELELGTAWVSHFNAKVIKQEFALPDNLEPVNILIIGYASDVQEVFNSYLESCITDAVF